MKDASGKQIPSVVFHRRQQNYQPLSFPTLIHSFPSKLPQASASASSGSRSLSNLPSKIPGSGTESQNYQQVQLRTYLPDMATESQKDEMIKYLVSFIGQLC
jgi:hypothetical protein